MYTELTPVARFHSKLKQVMLQYSAKRGEPLSQRQLAKDTGIALSTISRWYRDDNIGSIDPSTLSKLMEYFGVKFEELVEIEPEPPPTEV
jgi:transcriptional regulator with XRE-family HTH domain